MPTRGSANAPSLENTDQPRVERILDSCLDDIEAHRKRLADCLREYPSCADELRPLLVIALDIGAVPSVSPAAAFRRDLRRQLLEKPGDNAPQSPGSTTAHPVSHWRKVLVAIVLMTAISFALWGVVAASSTSLPGSLLYPIKRWTERIQVGLAVEPAPAWFHAKLARRRLDEAKALASCGEADRADQTALDYEGEINSAIDGLRADQENRVSDGAAPVTQVSAKR